MRLLMSLQKEKKDSPRRQVLGGVKGSARRGKIFSVLRLRQKKIFRPLTPARFCDTLRDWGNGLPVPPSPLGAEGESGAGFSFL